MIVSYFVLFSCLCVCIIYMFVYHNVCVLLFVIVCVYVCLFLGTTLYRHFSLLWNPSLEKLIIIIRIHFCKSKCVTTAINYYSKQ